MKLNILKLQQGGTPFVVYTPTNYNDEETSSTQQATSSKSSSKEIKEKNDDSDIPKLLSKEVINELIKKGLPSDVNDFLKELKNVESFSLDGNFDRNKLYSLTSKANLIINQANSMNEAVKQAYQNDGMEEIAVSTKGHLFAQDKNGNIKQMTMSEYDKKRDSYYALTVNDLSRARMYDTNLSFNAETISAIQNSIGINKISSYMFDIIGKIRKESIINEGFIDKSALKEQIGSMTNGRSPNDKELKGIQELANIYHTLGKDGIYKVTRESETQRNHLSDAYEYLWTLLPNNARNTLKARHTVDGNMSSNPEYLIRNMFLKSTSETTSTKYDYDSIMNKEKVSGKSGDGSEGGKAKQHNMTSLEQLVSGDLGRVTYQLNNPEDTSFSLSVVGNGIGQLVTANEQGVPATTLNNALNSGIGRLVDKNNMYFGSQKITSADLNSIVYDGEEVIKAWMPINNNGDIDFNILPNYTAAEREIENNNITLASDKNRIYKKYNLDIFIGENGKPVNTSKVAEFIVFKGASSTAVAKRKNNPYIFELLSNQQDGQKERLKSIYRMSGTKESPLEYPNNNNWFGVSNVVNGPVFLKLSRTAHNDVKTMVKKGSLVDTPTLEQDMEREQGNLTYGNTSSLYE